MATAEVTARPLDDRVRVEIDGELFTEYVFAGCENPFLYPVIGPHGIAMTRNYPMREIAGEAHDHPHHTSIWFAHDGLNGIDFWRTTIPGHGRVEQQRIARTANGADHAALETTNHWVGPDGALVCRDRRRLTFRVLPTGRAIDWEVTLQASDGDVTIQDTEEGTIGIRTHPNLRLENGEGVTSAGGQALNSEGVRGKDVWGKRAAWIDYSGNIDGRAVGIALFNHPTNLRHPTWWHARPYGLFTANPFGIHDFEGKPEGTGELRIRAGDSLTLRYRFIFHNGGPDDARVEQAYQSYAGQDAVAD
jgi:hypothetical protein